jgi:hypothetical protein
MFNWAGQTHIWITDSQWLISWSCIKSLDHDACDGNSSI